MKYRQKILILLLIIVTSGSSLIIGCGQDNESGATVESLVVEAQRGTLLTTVNAFGRISLPHQTQLTFGVGGTVSEVQVQFGDSVEKGEVLAVLDTSMLQRSVMQAEASLRTAQINLEKISEPASAAQIAQAEAAVASAKASLASAQSELENTQSNVVRAAEIAFENAQRSLEIAERNAAIAVRDAQEQVDTTYEAWYDYYWSNSRYLGSLDPDALPENVAEYIEVTEQNAALFWSYQKALENLNIAELQNANAIATAEHNVTESEQALNEVKQDAVDAQTSPVDIQQRESAVATAKAALATAEEEFSEIIAGADPLDIELKQIQVDNAQRALDEALEDLENAVITAPLDGIVANEVEVSAGDSVAANTGIILLVDTTMVGIDATVDEIDVAKVAPGQMARITLDALSDAMFMGQVTAVSPVARMESGVVTYKIALEVRNPQNAEVKEGMTASIEIVVLQQENVLLVPNRAITRSGQNRVVQVVIGEGEKEEIETEERVVEIGSSDAMRTEIISGLEEGEKVLMQAGGDISEFRGFSGGGPGGGMRMIIR